MSSPPRPSKISAICCAGLVSGARPDPEAERDRADTRNSFRDDPLAGVELGEDVLLHAGIIAAGPGQPLRECATQDRRAAASRKSPAVSRAGTVPYTINPPTRQTSSEPPVESPPYPETRTRPQPKTNRRAATISSREDHQLNGQMVLRALNATTNRYYPTQNGFPSGSRMIVKVTFVPTFVSTTDAPAAVRRSISASRSSVEKSRWIGYDAGLDFSRR